MTTGGEPNPRDVLPSTSRYELIVKIASGGMATVYVARSRAGGGVRRLFAVKRAHGHLLDDVVFRRMFAEEARLASKIHHPNVIAVQDVEELDHELLLIMDYVEGVALADFRGDNFVSSGAVLDPRTRTRVATRIVLDACAGLHAAHELRGDDGERHEIVHRDVSPHNVLVGVDGIGRVTDFGIAKSATRTSSGKTVTGGLKGKIGYMAPEYIETQIADRRADLFGLGVVLYEALTGERLFLATTEIELMRLVMQCEVPTPISGNRAIDAVVLRALAKSPGARFPTALEFGEALERAARDADLLATHAEVGAVVEQIARETLATRRLTIQRSTGSSTADQATVEESFDSSSYKGHDRTQTHDPLLQPVSDDTQTLMHGDDDGLSQTQEMPLPRAPTTIRVKAAGQPSFVDPTSPTMMALAATPLGPSEAPVLAAPRNNARGRVFVMVLAAMAVVVAWFGGSHLAKKMAATTTATTTRTTTATTTATAPPEPTPVVVTPAATPTVIAPPPTESATIPLPDPKPSATHAVLAPKPKPTPPRPTAQTTTATAGEGPSHAPPNPYKKDR